MLVRWALKNPARYLWVDTVNGNIKRYIERFMLPELRKLPRKAWSYNRQLNEIKIGESVIDFRSAEKPENIEGFGYKKIILNEAGIILGKNGDYLLNNVLLPMLLDEPDSQLIAAGAPKGELYKGDEHLFYTLAKKAENDTTGRYKFIRQTTYDNVHLSREDIETLESELDPLTAQQELHAVFIRKEGMLALYCFEEKHIRPLKYDIRKPLYLSFDFNLNPFVCLISQHWHNEKGFRYNHYIDEVFLNQTEQRTDMTHVENICKVIRGKYPDALYRVTGDASSMKGELTERLNRNAYTQIITYLELAQAHLRLPRKNPSISKSLEQCNSMLSKPNRIEILFDPKCKELITDFNFVKLKFDGTIDKASDSRRSHMLDAFRYDCNTYYPEFIYKEI